MYFISVSCQDVILNFCLSFFKFKVSSNIYILFYFNKLKQFLIVCYKIQHCFLHHTYNNKNNSTEEILGLWIKCTMMVYIYSSITPSGF